MASLRVLACSLLVLALSARSCGAAIRRKPAAPSGNSEADWVRFVFMAATDTGFAIKNARLEYGKWTEPSVMGPSGLTFGPRNNVTALAMGQQWSPSGTNGWIEIWAADDVHVTTVEFDCPYVPASSNYFHLSDQHPDSGYVCVSNSGWNRHDNMGTLLIQCWKYSLP